MDLKILFEDKHVIVVVKPPTIPSQGDKSNDEDMMGIIKKYLISSNPGTKKPYLGLVHRLDRPVGGVMVFAKTEFANAKLCEEIRLKKFKKIYYVVVCGKPEVAECELKDYLIKLRTVNMSKISTQDNKNADEAILSYSLIDSASTEEYGILSLLKVELKTGRHHQIRVQLSNANLPIWGDNKYNKTFVKMKNWTQIALWATSLSFKHPKENKVLEFENKPVEFPFSIF
jgi:23S rRNA pseudouridine1911/1915/1917 synthase